MTILTQFGTKNIPRLLMNPTKYKLHRQHSLAVIQEPDKLTINEISDILMTRDDFNLLTRVDNPTIPS